MTGRGGIEALMQLMNAAFGEPGAEAEESQALLPNLASVPFEAWRGLPPGASRSIESIVLHVGSCKIMYADYAFRDGTLQWADPDVQPWAEGAAPMAEAVDWLVATHARLFAHVASLDDDTELDRPSPTNWGDVWATRDILGAMITHDAYHAGEINHLRCMLGADDRWRHVQLGF